MRLHEKIKYRLRQKSYRKKYFKNMSLNVGYHFKDITDALDHQSQKFKNTRRKK